MKAWAESECFHSYSDFPQTFTGDFRNSVELYVHLINEGRLFFFGLGWKGKQLFKQITDLLNSNSCHAEAFQKHQYQVPGCSKQFDIIVNELEQF